MKFRILAAATATSFLLSTPAVAAEESWTDRLSFKGDVRIRYEGIDEQFESNRDRMRFRARFGLTAKVQDDLKVVIQLATGGDNPVSTNQTFDDGFSTKDIGLDLAYVDWKMNDNITLNAGKMKNPMYRAGKAPLIWDGDLNPEGIAAKFSSGAFFGTVGGFSAEERSSADDSLLFVVQGGAKVEIADAGTLTAGIGYFSYTDTIGNAPFFNGRARGNSVDMNGDYIYEYRNSELFAQFDTKLNDWAFQVFAQFTKNHEANGEDSAYSIGAKLGSAKDKGDMEFGWLYQDIEADAVISTFTDSDFGGGGTDAKGHIMKAKYALSKKVFLGGTLFLNEIDRFQGTEHDYNRIQIDLEFKFN